MPEISKEMLLAKLQELPKTLMTLLEKLPVPKELLIKRFLMLLTGVFAISLFFKITTFFLPQSSVHYQNKNPFIARHLYRLGDTFYGSAASAGKTDVQKSSQKAYTPLTAWKVQAIFNEDSIGFIVVLISGKTHFINLGDTHDGYKLVKIEGQQAILTRQGKEYALNLTVSTAKIDTAAPAEVEAEDSGVDIEKLKEGIVMRKDIATFMKDPKLIWENIKIRPFKENGKISGFLVRYVKAASVFDHLGLKAGDIITSANGIAMTSLQQAQDLYANIEKIDNVAITVKRQGTTQELTYEIQ